jgi:osmotically-inducible protein OsmY
MTSTTTQRDAELKTAVENELQWTPDIDAARIDVAVHDAVVTLSGPVSSYVEKTAAGHAARRVRSVAAVANELTVRHDDDEPTDAEILAAARTALNSTPSVPAARIHVEVRDRVATLTGDVMWHYQREAARKVVSRLTGIDGVDNRITLTERPAASAAETEELIRRAITRQATLDAARIDVRAEGGTVQLTGTVSSWAQKHQAELAAWASPHVTEVDNQISISD